MVNLCCQQVQGRVEIIATKQRATIFLIVVYVDEPQKWGSFFYAHMDDGTITKLKRDEIRVI